MPKAKTLDRLELTRRKMQMRTTRNHSVDVNEMIKDANHQGYDKCPKCGAMSLIHEGGCEHCISCGYDACGVH